MRGVRMDGNKTSKYVSEKTKSIGKLITALVIMISILVFFSIGMGIGSWKRRKR